MTTERLQAIAIAKRLADCDSGADAELLALARQFLECVERERWRPIEEVQPEHKIGCIVACDGAVGEAWYSEDAECWYWANTDPTDYVDGSVRYPTHFRLMPEGPE